jgi:5'-nucleotidase
MAHDLDSKLVIGIATRALFDLEEETRVFEQLGVEAYTRHQVEHERVPLQPGPGFSLVRGLLHVNQLLGAPLVEVVILSRNSAETGLRTAHSIRALDLPITRAAFTRGRPAHLYLEAFSCDLFLSAHEEDVVEALKAGFPAARILPVAPGVGVPEHEVRIAFDGDAVLFGPESQDRYDREGLEAFQAHEARHADVPMQEGPFLGFLRALCALQQRFPSEACPLRTALITARDAVSHQRVVRTLRAMDVRIDECFFLGGVAKDRILKAWRPHIFFDDQMAHVGPASKVSPAAQVPRHDKAAPPGARGGPGTPGRA